MVEIAKLTAWKMAQLIFLRIRVQFPAPKSYASQLHVTPAPEDQTLQVLHTHAIHALRPMHLKENASLFKPPADPALQPFPINLDPYSTGRSAETERWQSSCLRVIMEESALHTLKTVKQLQESRRVQSSLRRQHTLPQDVAGT